MDLRRRKSNLRMLINNERIEIGSTDLVRCKKKKTAQTPAAAAWRFMEEVTDDLLQEIFLRLPNGGSVIRFTTVCKRWHSLVHKYPSFDNFGTRFIRHHAAANKEEPYSYPNYVSALFRFSTTTRMPVPFYELRPSTSGLPKMYDLTFMPNHEKLIIRASCGDLLLLQLDYWKCYICNSVTRHWFELPEIPKVGYFERIISFFWAGYDGVWGYALFRHDSVNYSVVIVVNSMSNPIGECRFYLVIFDSSTGIWTQTPISLQYEVSRGLFACKKFTAAIEVVSTREGVLYWLDGTFAEIYVVAAFDPVSFESRLIPLPSESGLHVKDEKDSVRLGVVRGRLRLFLTEQIDESRIRVQIWELDDARWRLAHDIWLNIGTNELFFVLCLDVYDDNVIYLVRGTRISRYEIGQTEEVGICEFPWEAKSRDLGISEFPWRAKSIDLLRQLVARHLVVVPLVHPPWPTQTFSLHSSTSYQP